MHLRSMRSRGRRPSGCSLAGDEKPSRVSTRPKGPRQCSLGGHITNILRLAADRSIRDHSAVAPALRASSDCKVAERGRPHQPVPESMSSVGTVNGRAPAPGVASKLVEPFFTCGPAAEFFFPRRRGCLRSTPSICSRPRSNSVFGFLSSTI